jgi:phage-related protein
MLIDIYDILTTYNAKLLKKDIQSSEIVVYDDWLRNALNPLYIGKQIQYKIIKLQILVADTTDNACLLDISNLLSLLAAAGTVTIKFDDIDFYYDCTILRTDHKRLVTAGYFELNIELKSGYGYTAEVTEVMDTVLTHNITNPGNLPSPAILEITVPDDTEELTISGFGIMNDIILYNLQKDVPRIVDGELGIVLENGANAFSAITMWAFPVLQPGLNTISVSSSACLINIYYKPKYL